MRYRLIPFFLLIAALALAGCANGVPPTPGATPAPTAARPAATRAAPTATPAARLGTEAAGLDGTHVTFWYLGAGEAGAAFEAAVTRFNRANPWGIRAAARGFASSLELAAGVTTGGNAGPDLAMAYPEQVRAWAEGGTPVVDLAPYVSDGEWGLTGAQVADFPQPFWDQNLDGEALLGVPVLRDARLLFYNAGWARELGFREPPATPAEFQTQACAAAQAVREGGDPDQRGTGGWIVAADAVTDAAWIAAFGGGVQPSAEGEFTLNNPRTQAAFAYLKGLWDGGCAWISRDPSPYGYFAGRMALFYTGSLGDVIPQAAAMSARDSRDAWTVIPFPAEGGKPVLLVSGPSLAVLATEPEKQLAAWLLARWLIDPAQQAELAAASGQYPVRVSTLEEMQTYRRHWPQWDAAVGLLPYAGFTPPQASWRIARNVLEDATAQLYEANTQPDQIPAILAQLDQTVREVLQKGTP